MKHYVALDVSLREMSVSVMGNEGAVLFEGKTAADHTSLTALIRAKAPHVVRVGLETGATSPWLFHALTAAGLPEDRASAVMQTTLRVNAPGTPVTRPSCLSQPEHLISL